MEFVIDSPEKVIQIKKRTYMFIVLLGKSVYLTVGLGIFLYLAKNCLFNPDTNIVVTVYMALISLACFQALGVPVSRLVNLELLKP